MTRTTSAATSSWQPAPVNDSAAPVPTTTSAASTSDGQIAAALEASFRAILEQSHEVVKRAPSARVRQLAADLLDAYGLEESRLDALLASSGTSPVASAASAEVKSRGDEATRSLRALRPGRTFDRTYVEQQVRELERLRELVDRSTPDARSEALRGYLGALRTRVAQTQRSAIDVQPWIDPKRNP